jgi:CyaY protein
MVTLSFDNRSQIIINLQKPLQEIWMAARAGGFHYKCVDGHWRDTKGAGEFFAKASRAATMEGCGEVRSEK